MAGSIFLVNFHCLGIFPFTLQRLSEHECDLRVILSVAYGVAQHERSTSRLVESGVANGELAGYFSSSGPLVAFGQPVVDLAVIALCVVIFPPVELGIGSRGVKASASGEQDCQNRK